MGFAAACLCPSAAAMTYLYTFDKHFDWDDVAGPGGLGGLAFWEVTDTGGNPGGALRVWTNYWHKDIRAIQISVEPGTTVRIQFDVKIVHQDTSTSSFIRARYYDGYVTAISSVYADSLGSDWPAAIYNYDSGGDDLPWTHVDHTSAPVRNSVFTLMFHVEDFQTYYDEYLIDNLQIDFTPSSTFRDAALNWGGVGGTKFVDWRLNTNGQHIAWCDFLEERNQWFDGYCQIFDYPLTYHSWYDTTQCVVCDHAKGDYKHSLIDSGIAGVLRVDFSHDSNAAKIYGIRQTVSYAALGLAPGQRGTCTAQTEAAIYDEWNQATARFWLAVDPYGGRDIKEGRYPECIGCCGGEPLLWNPSFGAGSFHNLYSTGTWKLLTINWERPPDAEAFTVLVKCMDMHGNRKPPSYPYGGASEGADLMVNAFGVSAVPEPTPAIALSTQTLAHSLKVGELLPNDTFTVANSGQGTLSYTISVDGAPAWLSVAPDNGTSTGEADNIDLTYYLEGLGAGAHTATIRVEDPNASNNPQTIAVTVTIGSYGPDLDQDGDVDLADFSGFLQCFNGANRPYGQGVGCDATDFDDDTDCDLTDFAVFLACFNGPNRAVVITCPG